MSNSIRFNAIEAINPRGVPAPGFAIRGRLKNAGDRGVAILSVSCEVRWAQSGVLLQSMRVAETYDTVIAPAGDLQMQVPVDLTLRAVQAIENSRPPNGELEFRLAAEAIVAEVLTLPSGQPNRQAMILGAPTRVHVDVRGTDDHEGFRLSRDQWLLMLQAFGYAEYEVFELPVSGLRNIPGLNEAIAALGQAQAAFRNGDWEGTLAKTRSAFEAAATAADRSDDLATGFPELWAKALAQESDKPKREPLNELVQSLGKFQHLGRHKKFPFTPIDRRDAVLALRTTLAIFEYISTRLG